MPFDFDGKRITVMGLGRFGGGAGVTRWLVSQGAGVVVTDKDPEVNLAKAVEGIRDLVRSERVTLRLGGHNVSDFTTCDLVVANPAVPRPWEDRYLRSAQAAGVPVTTEIRLLTECLAESGIADVIGITGSAGKSTTSALIQHLLTASGVAAHFGGNIGGSLLNSVNAIGRDDWVVLELSSAMLHWLGDGIGFADAKGWSPRIAALTNITPNHIDWHGSFEHYRESKHNIFRWQPQPSIALRGEDLPGEADRIDLRIPGEHNQRNARLAIEAVHRATGISAAELAKAAGGFAGLPHRLQLVGERDGMRFYNDSKSTTPEATTLAVASFDDPSRVHLIAGGYDKKIDLSPIAALGRRVGGMYVIGATGPALASASSGSAAACATLDRAVQAALEAMKPGDILLLSPGCASWDQFANFEERGDVFARLVNAQ